MVLLLFFSSIKLQANIDEGSSCSIKMQITRTIDKKSFWVVHCGCSPFANNKLNHSEFNKVACAEGATSKQYTGTENFCHLLWQLFYKVFVKHHTNKK